MSTNNTNAIGTGVDAAGASRDFRASAVLVIGSMDCSLFLLAASVSGTVTIDAGSIMTVERIA